MKVLFDPEIFFYGRCGMVRYYSRLLAGLRARGFEIDLPLLVSGSDFISGKMQALESLQKLPFAGKRLKVLLDNLSKRNYRKKVAAGNYNLVFISSPVFEDTFLEYLPAGKPFIMVCHDTMRCVLGPEGLFDPAGNNADKLAYLARRASKVICISQKVQKDLMLLADIEAGRAPVIYTGNLLDITADQAPGIKIPAPYLLFVGARTGRKNFRFFIQSIALLLKETGLHVVCTGPCTPWEADLLDYLEVKNQVFFIEAPDPVLVNLYKNAACLVYPSLYEGYGLPVLEAMSLGCPVITSDFGALAEVGQDAVMYIDPYSKESVVNGVKELLTDEAKRQTFIQKGFKQAKNFIVDAMIDQFKAEIENLPG